MDYMDYNPYNYKDYNGLIYGLVQTAVCKACIKLNQKYSNTIYFYQRPKKTINNTPKNTKHCYSKYILRCNNLQ